MTDGLPEISVSLSNLRREFDLTFAAPPRTETVEFENLVAIRVGSAPYAIRLSAITDLFADRRITALPDASPELLGIAGFRGIIVPVYDLRVLLGQPVGGNPRWMVLVERRVAFAFDNVDGCIRVARGAILLGKDGHEVAHTEITRPIVNLSMQLKNGTDLPGRADAATPPRRRGFSEHGANF